MKKALFIVSLFAVMMLVSVPQATALEPTDSVAVTVTIEVAAVSVTPEYWELDVVALESVSTSSFGANNIGTVDADFDIACSNSLSGYWTCSVSGENTFAMDVSVDEGSTWTDICGDTPGIPLATSVAPASISTFDLQFTAPASIADNRYGPESITVLVTASMTP